MVALDGANTEKDVAGAAERIASADPQALVIAGPLEPTAVFMRTMKTWGVAAQHLVLSNLSADSFVAALGDAAPGVVLTQVVPYAWNLGTSAPARARVHQVIRESPGSGAVLSIWGWSSSSTRKCWWRGCVAQGRIPREGFID